MAPDERRRAICRAIENSLPRSETAAERRFREIVEARRAKEAEEREREAKQVALVGQQTRTWADWVNQRIAEAIEALPPISEAEFAIHGRLLSNSRLERDAVIAEELSRLGKELRKEFDAKLAETAERLRSVPGRLPPVQVWSEGIVAYEGQVFSHAGRLWQARCNTGFRPDVRHADWVCLARTIAPSFSLGELDRHDAQRAREEAAKAIAELRTEIGEKFLALTERTVDALASRPIVDQSQVDHAVEVAVAHVRQESGHALEAQRREIAFQLEVLKERVADVASRSSSDQSQIERAAAAEIAVARLRVGLDDVVEVKARAFDARLADFETQRREFAAQLQELRERLGDVARRLNSDRGQIERPAAAAAETGVAKLRVELADLIEAQARAFETRLADLETPQREFAVHLQALRERLGDVERRPSLDQSLIEQVAAAAAETGVARLRVGLNDVVEAQARAFDARLADLEPQRREFAVQLQGLKERIGDIGSRPASIKVRSSALPRLRLRSAWRSCAGSLST
jgi:hypothetical protein